MKKYFKSLILVILIIVLSVLILKRLFPLKYEHQIDISCTEYGVDKSLVLAIIKAESGFDEEASSGRANGIMQLAGETAKWVAVRLGLEYSEEMVYAPDVNIEMGSYYLAYLVEKYENTETALAAYNAGMGNVSAWLKNEDYSKDGVTLYHIPYGETKRYVERVMKVREIYKILY